jgi:phosphoenolpyruvate synthase/pyruvate phosphate dikinase
VINGPGDFGRLRAGDVLVCQTTTPAWTPLFASAGALVTDTGGILSHAAIVAREYRLPAVVGCDVATTAIRDGARVEVDGDAGRVRVALSESL